MRYRPLAGPVAFAGLALLLAMTPGIARSNAEPGHKSKETAAGHSHEMCELHGGTVVMTPVHHFEALFAGKEIRLYAYDEKQAPIPDPGKAKILLTLQPRQGKAETMTMKYMAPNAPAGRIQGHFVAARDFKGYQKGAMKATFHVEGLSAKPEDFKMAVVIGEPVTYQCPMHPEVVAEDPGKCPKCGMNLTRMGMGAEHEHGGSSHNTH